MLICDGSGMPLSGSASMFGALENVVSQAVMFSVLVDERSRQIAHLRGCRPFSEFEPAVSLRTICLSFPDLATVGTRCASPLRMHASNGGPPIPRCRCCRGEQKAHLSVFVSVRLKTRLAFLRHAEGKRVARQRLILACETGLVASDAVLQENAKVAAKIAAKIR